MDKLGETYFFADLSAEELDTLKGLTEIKEVGKGETVVKQGTPSDHLFIVRTGSVRVLVPAPEGMEVEDDADQTLVILGPKECFGEFAFVDRKPASASVQAAEDSSVYVIPYASLDTSLLAVPASAAKIYKALVHILVSRFRNTDIELAMRKAYGG